jgi:hypothetical protein
METGRVTNAVVFGLDHDIQENDDGGRLEVIIRVLFEKYQCDLIAEEWNAGPRRDVVTVARRLANTSGIRWLNMPEAIREERGILTSLNRRIVPVRVDPKSGQVVPELSCATYLPKADGIREEYWLGQVQAAQPKKCTLVTCGLIHVRPFGKKMEEAGFLVETSSLCDHAWYRSKPDSKCAEVEKNLRDERY